MTPAQALGWELWRRHRRGFLAVGAYLVALGASKLVVLARGVPIAFGSDERFAFTILVPLSSAALYLLGVFTYGLSGDLAARRSMFPARTFTLPVPDASLVDWPMLYGAGAMIALWAAGRGLAPWPAALAVPQYWPAAIGVALLAWTQALTWMAYPVSGARIVVAILVLQVVDGAALLALHARLPEWVMLAITVPQIPLAWVTARYAVARARRGVVPDWSRPSVAPGAARGRRAFTSAASAQAWFEWQRHGRALPVWVAVVLPFVLLLLWAAGRSTALVVTTLLAALVAPVVLAMISGVTVARSGTPSHWFGLPPFSAVRPLTDGGLLAAKLRMTLWSTLAAWAVVAGAIPLALAWSGTWPLARDFGRNVVAIVGAPRAAALLALVVGALLLSTWRQLVQSLCIGLTGSERLIKGSMFAWIVAVSILGPVGIWIVDSGRLGAVWSMLPFLLSAAVAAKMGAAAWVAARLVRARALADRLLLGGAMAWTTAVLMVFGALAWLADTPHIPRYLLLLIAILLVPLGRLSAAALAVQQNRHR